MRNEPILKSMQRMAEVEPGFWRDIQKNLNKYNEQTGSRFSMFDMLSDAGKSPVHINAREDRALGDVPHMPFKGTGQDDRIANLTPFQQAILKARGGSGAINPKTGLREYDDGGWGDGGNWSGDGGSSDSGRASDGIVWDIAENAEGPGPDAPGPDDGSPVGSPWDVDEDVGPDYSKWTDAGDYTGGMGDFRGGEYGGPMSASDFGPQGTAGPGGYNDTTGPDAKTGSGKESDASEKLGLGPKQGPGVAGPKGFLDSIRDFNNWVKSSFPDPLGLNDPNNPEAQKNTMSLLGASPFALGAVETAVDFNKNSIANDMYGKDYKDLDSLERQSVDNNWLDSQTSINGDSGNSVPGDEIGESPLLAPAAPGAPVASFTNAPRPSTFGGDMSEAEWNALDPLQQRTHVASTAVLGPGSVYRTPEWRNYMARLMLEAANQNQAPTAIERMYISNVLGGNDQSIPLGVTDIESALAWRDLMNRMPYQA